MIWRNAFVFGSHYKCYRFRKNGLCVVFCSFFACCHQLNARCHKKFKRIPQILFATYGDGKQCACRSFYSICTDRSASFAWNDNGIDPCTFAGTGYCSEITYISNTIEHNNKRHFALFINAGNNVFDALISHR